MKSIFSEEITYNQKTLLLVILNNNSKKCDHREAVKIAHEEFYLLAPYIQSKGQILFIRDNPELTIENRLPAGHTYFPTESMIAVPNWSSINYTELRAVIAHELHHMARSQNIGYGSTLGEAIASEGLATYYEEIRSGRTAEWATIPLDKSVFRNALSEWNSDKYYHYEWFYDGPNGKWVGYSLGYKLAKQHFPKFNLKQSVTKTLPMP